MRLEGAGPARSTQNCARSSLEPHRDETAAGTHFVRKPTPDSRGGRHFESNPTATSQRYEQASTPHEVSSRHIWDGRRSRDGALWGGVKLTSSPHVEAVTKPYAWATAATVASIERAALVVHADDTVVETALGGDPVGFLRIEASA